MRLAAQIEMYDVHASLVVNLDQTGVHLVPASFWTYNSVGSSSVAVVGAEDKRQITAVVASSLYGDMLPLQLIFQGKTERSHPAPTASSKSARVHVTHSPNHWSSVETMQQWVENVLIPYRERCVRQFELRACKRLDDRLLSSHSRTNDTVYDRTLQHKAERSGESDAK